MDVNRESRQVSDLAPIRQSHIKRTYLNLWVALQQLCSHICLPKLISYCCFAPYGRRESAARGKKQEEINFAKQMCEQSCWRATQRFRWVLLIWESRIVKITIYSTVSLCFTYFLSRTKVFSATEVRGSEKMNETNKKVKHNYAVKYVILFIFLIFIIIINTVCVRLMLHPVPKLVNQSLASSLLCYTI